MLSVQCVLDLCPGVSLWGWVQVQKEKEAPPERRYSDVFCLSVKYIQRAGSLSEELKSMKRNETQRFMLNSLPQIQESVCMRARLCGQWVKSKDQMWSVWLRAYRQGFIYSSKSRCQVKIPEDWSQIRLCFCSSSHSREKTSRNWSNELGLKVQYVRTDIMLHSYPKQIGGSISTAANCSWS